MARCRRAHRERARVHRTDRAHCEAVLRIPNFVLLLRLTEFGNAVVLIPLAVLVALWLRHTGARRAALAWGMALLACVATIAVLKIYFLGCPLPRLGLRSPSGHAGFSAFVYGGVTLCAAHGEREWRRVLLAGIGCAWIAAIAWSRYAIHAHTIAEIASGLAIGTSALALFRAGCGPLPSVRFPFVPASSLAAAIVLLCLALHWRWNFESPLQQIGRLLMRWLPICAR